MDVMTSSQSHAVAGLTLTTPGVIALVGYLLLGFVVLMPFDMYTYDEQSNKYVKTGYSFGQRCLLLLILCLPFFLAIYSVNCMMVGNCKVWSWIVAGATLLWAVIVVLTTLYYKSFNVDDVQPPLSAMV